MRIGVLTATILALWPVCAVAAEQPTTGLITGQDVYVRSGPDKTYRDMGTLDKHAFVQIQDVSADGKWLRIIAPADANVWVFTTYVNVVGGRGLLKGNKVRVRVRPDLTGEVVNHVNKGAVVTVKGRKGDWLRIAPPAGTVAWVSAGYVERMTDAKIKAFRAKQAEEAAKRRRLEAELAAKRRRLEAELAAKRRRLEAELARRRAEEARRRREAQLVAGLDKMLAGQLKLEIRQRRLAPVIRAYRDAERKVKDARLRTRIGTHIAALGAMDRIRAALARKAFPPALPKLDYARLGAEPVIRELRRSHGLAQTVARDEQRRVARRPKDERRIEGWVYYLGPGLRQTGATHRIILDREVLALVRSATVDLASFVGMRVRITGKIAGHARLSSRGTKTEVVDIARVQLLFE